VSLADRLLKPRPPRGAGAPRGQARSPRAGAAGQPTRAMAAAQPAQPTQPAAPAVGNAELAKRQVELSRRLAQLQWDLGGLVYEMAIRDHFRLDLVVRQAAELQSVDAELGAVERMLRMEQAGAAGTCPKCGALYPRGAVFCWQCGNDLMERAPVGGEAARPAQAPAQGTPAEGAQPTPEVAQQTTPGVQQTQPEATGLDVSTAPPDTRPPGGETSETPGKPLPGWGAPDQSGGEGAR
jgi:hypothetical protein